MSVEKEYEFKYNGDSHEININTLLATQFHFSAIVNELHRDLFPDTDIEIRVKSFEKGSFDVNQVWEIAAPAGMFAVANVEYIPTIISTLSDYLSIKLYLKDKKAYKATKGEGNTLSISVEGDNNVLLISEKAFDIYQNNVTIDKSLSKISEALETDTEIEGIEIQDTSEEIKVIDIPRQNFEALQNTNPYLNEETKVECRDTVVAILRWETIPKKNTKWSFIYDNRKINQVTIKDDKFLARILKDKLRFGAGDRLRVTLEVKLKKDEYTGYYIEDKFSIVHVSDIIWRDEQGELNLK